MKPTFLTKKIVLAVLLVASFARAQDSPQTARNVVVSVTNEAVTGTTRYRLAKLTGAPATAIIAATSDTDGVVGIVTSNAGITGQAIIQMQGQVACDFDDATTAGNYVQISSSSAGVRRFLLVPAAGVEPATFRSGGERSNPLSYAGKGRIKLA